MSAANPSRLGQVNGAGDALALMLKVFSGEVLTAYQRESLFRGLHTIRTIASGKSAQFPATGQIQPYYHVPGEEILGERINANEKTINIEGMLIAPWFVANIDELLNHYDMRGVASAEIGQALAKIFDQNVSREFINAARVTTPNVAGVYPGDVLDGTLTTANYGTDGPTIFAGIQDANVLLDTRDVPRTGRFAVMDPTRYALLIKSEKPFDYRLNSGQTGLGGYAQGKVVLVDGLEVFKSNNYAKTNDMTAPLQPARRQHDYSTSQVTVAHRSAVGTVALQDVTMETQYDMRRQGTLMLGKYVCGHGELRPEASVELQSSAPAG